MTMFRIIRRQALIVGRGERGGTTSRLRSNSRNHHPPCCGHHPLSSLLAMSSSSSASAASPSSFQSHPKGKEGRGSTVLVVGGPERHEPQQQQRRQQHSLARRHLSISRHPDPLVRHGNINTADDDDEAADGDAIIDLLDASSGGENNIGDSKSTRKVILTADDFESMNDFLDWGVGGSGDDDDDDDGLGKKNRRKNKQGDSTTTTPSSGGEEGDLCYDDIFGNLDEDLDLGAATIQRRQSGDDEDDDQDPESLAYHARQAKIKESLDSKTTGRLWKTSWNITDEEWMTDEEWDDIEDWKPTLATRKSLESVRIYEDSNGNVGVPTLQSLAELRLPDPLPQHPGYGNPSIYATYRRRRITEKIRSSVVRAARDDVAKMVHPSITNDQRRDMVDELYECIVDRVRDVEPVLGKLPDFAKYVELALEEVLITVRNRAMKLERDAIKKKKIKDAGLHGEEEEEEKTLKEDEERSSSKSSSKSSATVDEQKFFVNSVMEVLDEYESPTPIFMDVLAATQSIDRNQRNQPQDSNDDNDAGGSAVVDTTSTYPSFSPTISKFFASSDESGVPHLLYPLTVHPKEGVGRMVEEWQLAANKETKRIMIRDAMRDVARAIVEATGASSSEDTATGGAARVFVTGKRGVGKTAALAGIVASARISGHIVVYHPDGDRLRKHGYYIEPCSHRVGLYNLPEIAKELCAQLLKSHGEDVSTLPGVTRESMKDYFSDDQMRRLFRRAYATEVESGAVPEEDVATMPELSLDKLLTVGVGSSSLSSGCYSAVISNLMNQTVRPFTVVMDEFNCYYDHGHYFHMDYDENVRKGVPLNRITIFKPFMDAMGLYPEETGTDITKEMAVDSGEAMMKLGSIVVSTSDSKAVRQSFTRALIEYAQAETSDGSETDASPPQCRHPIHFVDVQRYSTMEVQHILYNFEIIGIGRLRFDRGETALNPEEVDYLRMISGGCGQQLLDSCMLPSK